MNRREDNESWMNMKVVIKVIRPHHSLLIYINPRRIYLNIFKKKLIILFLRFFKIKTRF
jgi:hypothetical protein